MGPFQAAESVELSYPAVDNNNKKLLFPKQQPVPQKAVLSRWAASTLKWQTLGWAIT